MQKFISKYAAAAHLAILAVAPLLLYPLLGERSLTPMWWLLAFAVVWIFMGPSVLHGESLGEARARVLTRVLHDPFVWFASLAIVWAAIRAFNTGIGLAYDAERSVWFVSPAAVSAIPGSVGNAGRMTLFSIAAATVIMIGFRHSFGRNARMAFGVFASAMSAFVMFVLAALATFDDSALRAATAGDYVHPEFLGTACGIWWLLSLTIYFYSVAEHSGTLEVVELFALIAGAVGVAAFAPPITIVVFAVAFAILLAAAVAGSCREFNSVSMMQCVVVALLSLVALGVVLKFGNYGAAYGDKLAAILDLKPFSEDALEIRGEMSDLALRVWKSFPWFGTGAGTLNLDVRFYADGAQMDIIPAAQSAIPNGWWQLLLLHGAVGAIVALAFAGFALWEYGVNFIRGIREGWHHPAMALAPTAILVMLAVTCFDSSLWRPDAILALTAAVAFSAAVLRPRATVDLEHKETENG